MFMFMSMYTITIFDESSLGLSGFSYNFFHSMLFFLFFCFFYQPFCSVFFILIHFQFSGLMCICKRIWAHISVENMFKHWSQTLTSTHTYIHTYTEIQAQCGHKKRHIKLIVYCICDKTKMYIERFFCPWEKGFSLLLNLHLQQCVCFSFFFHFG